MDMVGREEELNKKRLLSILSFLIEQIQKSV